MVYHLSETCHRVLIRHNYDRHCNLRQNVRKVLLSFSGCSAWQRGALRTSAERATDSWVTGSQPGESSVTGSLGGLGGGFPSLDPAGQNWLLVCIYWQLLLLYTLWQSISIGKGTGEMGVIIGSHLCEGLGGGFLSLDRAGENWLLCFPRFLLKL